MRGFVPPRDPRGAASLYAPPPWRFAGRSITVFASCDPAGVAALVPAPLSVVEGAAVRFSVHELTCDLGFGWDWAMANPARARFNEAVVGIAVRHGGRTGFWDPFLWTDSDAELAVGREFYGWPQRFGNVAMTAPHAVDGWRAGDVAAGLVSRHGEAAFRLAVTLADAGPAQVEAPEFEGFFLERIIPDPTDGSRQRDVFFARMDGVRIAGPWSGPGELALIAPELAGLGTPRVLAGQVHAVAWVKAAAERVWRETMQPG